MAAKPRIAASNYSNSAPLIWSFWKGSRRDEVEMTVDAAPAKCAEMLRNGEVDAALVPVIAFKMIDGLTMIPNVCVGATGDVKSVCLVTKGMGLEQAKSLALDNSSRTSAVLTKIIYREFLGYEPEWRNAAPDLEQMLADADCAMLIGDPALMVDESEYRKFDLAGLWKQHTGFGFVFAMWMARGEKLDAVRGVDFAAARDEGLNNLDEIIEYYRNDIPKSVPDFKEYLTHNIQYSIDDSMQKGMELYFELARKNGLV